MFTVYLHAFRCNLQRYHLPELSAYFEENYFKPDRIKQWACWYRVEMFHCEWILDTNMHVEACHDVLKSHIMKRKKISVLTSYFASCDQLRRTTFGNGLAPKWEYDNMRTNAG